MKKLLTLAAALTLSGSVFADVNVDNAYARAVAPGQQNSAAFLTLKNMSAENVALVSAESSVASTVELHSHAHGEDGVMRMRRIPQISMFGKEMVELKPGGFHIMLIGLKQNLKVGEQIDLKLNFSDDSSQELSIPVKQVMAAMGKKHSH